MNFIFLFLYLFSFNIYATEQKCGVELGITPGKDYNEAVLASVAKLCELESQSSSIRKRKFRALVTKFNEKLKTCLEKFNCKEVKGLFLTEVLDNNDPEIKDPITKVLLDNDRTKRFVDPTGTSIYRTIIGAYVSKTQEDSEENKVSLRSALESLESSAKELKTAQERLESCYKPGVSCSESDIQERQADLRSKRALYDQGEYKVRVFEFKLDPKRLRGKVIELVGKYHTKVKKALEKKVKEDPTCKGLKITIIEECAKVSEEFRQHVIKQNEEYEKIGEAYEKFDEELQEAVDDQELLKLMGMASIKEIRKKFGITSGDENYMMDELYKKMDNSLLSSYIDEKAMAAICAAKDNKINCNLDDSSDTKLSNFRNNTKEIKKQIDAIRKVKSSSGLSR